MVNAQVVKAAAGDKIFENVLLVSDDAIAQAASEKTATKIRISSDGVLSNIAKALQGFSSKHSGKSTLFLLLPLAGCGSGGSGSSVVTGTAVDGYIVGGTVARVDGSNTVTLTTNDIGVGNGPGTFTLSSLDGSGAYIVSGGTDIGTPGDDTDDLTFSGALIAPESFTVATPLTTLVHFLAPTGDVAEIAAAQADVLASLGLSATFDLSAADPYALAVAGDDSAFAVYSSGVQVATLLSQSSGGDLAGFKLIAEQLAIQMETVSAAITAGTSTGFDLTSSDVVSTFLSDAATAITAGGSTFVVDQTALDNIMAVLAEIQSYTSATELGDLTAGVSSVSGENGIASKGPLHQALVFADYNGDGELTAGEQYTYTESDGSYVLGASKIYGDDMAASYGTLASDAVAGDGLDDVTGVAIDTTGFDRADYSIVVSMGADTIDYSTGESYATSAVALKAAPGGGMITPMTTVHEHSKQHSTDFEISELTAALGLPADVNILTFNPHAAGVDEATAHEVESLQQHLMTTTMMVQAAIKGSGTPATGVAVSDEVAHDAALDSLIKLIIEVHKANNEEGGSESSSITGDLDLADVAHLEELEALVEADLEDTSEGALGATMEANGSSVPAPVLEYVLEHAGHAISLVNGEIDKLESSDHNGVNQAATSHLKHDVADQIELMATAARAHYDAWLAGDGAVEGAVFESGVADETTGVLTGGDWATFNPDTYLTLNTQSTIDAQLDLNRTEYLQHLADTAVLNETTGAHYATLGAAVAAATADDVISLRAGTYAEDVTIDKALTIKGANQGVSLYNDANGDGTLVNSEIDVDTTTDARTGGFEESWINGTITVAADNVTLDGLRMNNVDGPLVFDAASAGANNSIDEFTLKNSYVTGYAAENAPDLTGSGDSAYVGSTLGTDWLVKGNLIGGVVSGVGGAMYLGGLDNSEAATDGDAAGLIENIFWRPAAGHLYVSSLTDVKIVDNFFYHGLHADGADMDGNGSAFVGSSGYGYGYGYGSGSAYGYGSSADGFGYEGISDEDAALLADNSNNFYGRNYWLELKGVNSGVLIDGNDGAYNSGGIQLYGETGTGFTFDDITISNNTFTNLVNADPNGVMMSVFGSSYDQLMSPITISLKDGVATGKDIIITGNTINMPVDQIVGAWDQTHAIQVRGDVEDLTISNNDIDFTEAGLVINTADSNMADWALLSGYSALSADAIFLVGDISGAISIDGNTIDKASTNTSTLELQGVVIVKSDANYGDMATADVTSLSITDTAFNDQFTYGVETQSITTPESVSFTDLELVLDVPGDLAGEKFVLTTDTIESAVLQGMTVAEATDFMVEMTDVQGVLSKGTTGFVFDTDQIAVGSILSGSGYGEFVDAESAVPTTLVAGKMYYIDGADQLTAPQDNAIYATAVLNTDEAVVTVSLTYDADSTIGTSHYQSRMFDFAESATVGNPGLLAEWLDVDGNFDYLHLLLNSPANITSAASASVAENAVAGATVLQVAATDSESDTLTYALVDSSNLFEMDATGLITVATGAAFDHETTDSYNVTVQVTDDGSSATVEQVVAIAVGDINEAPVMTSGATGTAVADGTGAGQVVYTATGTDVDDGDVLSYALSGADAGKFTIDAATGAVSLTAAADYATQASYAFSVVATDDDATPLSSAATDVTVAVQSNLISLVAEVVTLASAADSNGFTTTDTDKYIKLTIGLDMAGLDSSYAGTKLEGISGDLVLDGSDFLVASAAVKNAGSSTATAELGAGFLTDGNLTVNDVFASAETSPGLGSFAKGASGGLVDNIAADFDSVLATATIGVIYLNVDEENVSEVTIGLENAFATEGSDSYSQDDYSITVDII
ncbi:cadherin repeat domain-containing protein [Litorivicinus sp.]|nr:cadherin repeat domain-containing protein [Litorivicinus sp.]